MRLVAIAILLAVNVAALPASAQIVGSMQGLSGRPGNGIRGDILPDQPSDPRIGPALQIGRQTRSIRASIRAGRESGQLTRSEARSLYREAARISAAGARYGRDGYGPGESGILQARIEGLRGLVAAKRGE
jgi:hypothetical protein